MGDRAVKILRRWSGIPPPDRPLAAGRSGTQGRDWACPRAPGGSGRSCSSSRRAGASIHGGFEDSQPRSMVASATPSSCVTTAGSSSPSMTCCPVWRGALPLRVRRLPHARAPHGRLRLRPLRQRRGWSWRAQRADAPGSGARAGRHRLTPATRVSMAPSWPPVRAAGHRLSGHLPTGRGQCDRRAAGRGCAGPSVARRLGWGRLE